MAQKLEDLNLPNASVLKIIKDALPDSVNVGKDARSALSRAASVFVLYVTSQASKESQKCKRKTLTAQDVLTALEELEFDEFLEPLQKCHEEFLTLKKEKSIKKKRHSTADAEIAEESAEEVGEEDAAEPYESAE